MTSENIDGVCMTLEDRQKVKEMVERWETSHPPRKPAEVPGCYGARRMGKAVLREHMNPDACGRASSGEPFINCFFNGPEFQGASTVREQIYVGVTALVEHRMGRADAFKEIDRLLCYDSVHAVRRLYDGHVEYLATTEKERGDKSLCAPGRPRSFSRKDMITIVTYVCKMYVQRRILTLEMLCDFADSELGIDATKDTIRRTLKDAVLSAQLTSSQRKKGVAC